MDTPTDCVACGAQLAAALRACPVCGRLVHAEALKRLAGEAEAAQAQGSLATALGHWRDVLGLLPPASRQYQVVQARVVALSGSVAAAPVLPAAPPAPMPRWLKRLGPLGAGLILLWKLKFLLVALLSKAKFLLLGLTKATTVLTMLVSLGAYWALYGWAFALGLVLVIYVHEIGHVVALQRFGIAASPPMFIPGFGALVRMGSPAATAVEDATVGLAGPLWGLFATLGCLGIGFLSGSVTGLWGALAHTSAWLNLLNLLPLWQLDGARGFAALSPGQRWLVAAAFGGCWALTGEGILALLGVVAALRALGSGSAPAQGDSGILVRFLFLIGALAWLTSLPVVGKG